MSQPKLHKIAKMGMVASRIPDVAGALIASARMSKGANESERRLSSSASRETVVTVVPRTAIKPPSSTVISGLYCLRLRAARVVIQPHTAAINKEAIATRALYPGSIKGEKMAKHSHTEIPENPNDTDRACSDRSLRPKRLSKPATATSATPRMNRA
jgi:hypothetical protein